MKPFEKAIHQFLKKYQDEPYFEGAILCGSYATGNQTPHSDIDIHILISDTENWRERGVQSENGFMIEYFINPPKKIKESFIKEQHDFKNATANMYAQGVVLMDKNGLVNELKSLAIQTLQQKMSQLTKNDLYPLLYSAWDLMDEITSLFKENRPLNIIYYKLAETLMEIYCKSKGFSIISLSKIEKILSNPDFAKRYNIPHIPDEKFTQLFLAVLYDVNIQKINELYSFVINQVGGFDIFEFKMRSEIKN